MATATIEKSKELREEATSVLAIESPCEAVVVCPLPFGSDESVNAGQESDALSAAAATNVSMPIHWDGFLTSLVGRLAVFNAVIRVLPYLNRTLSMLSSMGPGMSYLW